MYMIKESIAERKSETAIPDNNRVSTAIRPFLCEIIYTVTVDAAAPIKAKSGMNNPPRKTIAQAAPRAPPVEVPMI